MCYNVDSCLVRGERRANNCLCWAFCHLINSDCKCCCRSMAGNKIHFFGVFIATLLDSLSRRAATITNRSKCLSVLLSARTSLNHCGVMVFKILQFRHCWADVDDTWHVYTAGLRRTSTNQNLAILHTCRVAMPTIYHVPDDFQNPKAPALLGRCRRQSMYILWLWGHNF